LISTESQHDLNALSDAAEAGQPALWDLRDNIIGYGVYVTAGQGDLYTSDTRHTAIDAAIRRMLDLHASDPAACAAALSVVLDAAPPAGLEAYDRGIQDALFGRPWIAPASGE
jgi:hypothetical protein